MTVEELIQKLQELPMNYRVKLDAGWKGSPVVKVSPDHESACVLLDVPDEYREKF